MQFDQSTTTVTLGKITMAKVAGEPIPEGWGFWPNGGTTEQRVHGRVISRDVKPLKVPEGPSHDLGQFYNLIDPASGQAFYD